MKVVVTGSQGFIGKNLCVFLREKQYEVLEIHRETNQGDSISYLSQADFVFHLAGINRPKSSTEFHSGNIDLTSFIVNTLAGFSRNVPIVLASSTKVDSDSEYGVSKLAAEEIVQKYSKTSGSPSYIYRFSNVFGKWCKPNYNSFVATFCNNILNGIDISIHDPNAIVRLIYIDDVCEALMGLLDGKTESGFHQVPIEFKTTVGEVANIITSFKSSRKTLISERVGTNLKRALYSTYLSYTVPDKFSYPIPSYSDERGIFCEMLKTKDSGQISFFTAHPGITRGGHYHHTKNEKFLIVKGEATFKFENIITGERYKLSVSSSNLQIIDTIPGWSHDITNTGDEELVVMLWANEIFDQERPDTIASELF